MAEPQIQYARTDDGVSIAYYTIGEGPPIVTTSLIYYSHLLVGRRMRLALGQLLEPRHSVVRYDGRGSGLSERESPDFSLAARLLDLEAVVDRLGLERFALFGPSHGGLAAVAYAVRHPERVTHLILWNAYARGRDYYASSPALRAFAAMREIAKDQWESYTLTVASWEVEFADSDRAKELAAVSRASLEPDALLAFKDASVELDVTDLLPRVRMPTLVLARASQGFAHLQSSQVLASRIPDARLVVLESLLGGLGADGLRAIGEFLGDDIAYDEAPAEGTAMSAPALPSATVIILFADIADSTALTERMGDAAFRARARDLDTSLRAIIAEAGGTTIDGFLSGDGVLATFPAASQAIAGALACGVAGDAQGLPLHLGLHAGDVIREQNNVFGGAVNIASRISGLSAPGEVLVSRTVADLARTSAGVTFEDRGEQELKGVSEPVRVFAVRPLEPRE